MVVPLIVLGLLGFAGWTIKDDVKSLFNLKQIPDKTETDLEERVWLLQFKTGGLLCYGGPMPLFLIFKDSFDAYSFRDKFQVPVKPVEAMADTLQKMNLPCHMFDEKIDYQEEGLCMIMIGQR